MLRTPKERRRRLAAIREKTTGRKVMQKHEATAPTGEAFVEVILDDGSARLATADEAADLWSAMPREPWEFTVEDATPEEIALLGVTKVARPHVVTVHPHAVSTTAPLASEQTPQTGTTREHRSPSKSRTISRRARTSATSTADPSSSRPRGGNRPLRSVRIETTRLALRLALLVIGGSR